MHVSKTERLHDLVVDRYEVAQGLYALTQAHAAAASNDDLAATISILSRKETLVDRLRQIHSDLEIYQRDVPESRVWRNAEHRHQTQQLADQSDELLKKILELDGQTLRSMQLNRDALAAQLHHGHDSLSVRQAYSTPQILSEGLLDISEL